jgi:thiosulfate/3-mercaptopyruvate sulfurtransferase
MLALALAVITASASAQTAQSAFPPGSAQLITTEDLLKLLQGPPQEKPLILDVGPSLLYMQARIPSAEYIGAASTPQGIASLRNRAKALPHTSSIVLYCGCCPWEHCPNVAPAFNELQKLGFKQVKVLYIPNNFGADWVDKGYPTVRGH